MALFGRTDRPARRGTPFEFLIVGLPLWALLLTLAVLITGLLWGFDASALRPIRVRRLRAAQAAASAQGATLPAEAEQIDPPALWPRDPPVRFRKSVPDGWIRLTIREGRNRQVRRMTAAVGHPTLRLVRWAVGDLTLDGLAPGAWREAGVQA